MPDVKWVATSLVSLVVAIIVIATVAVPVIEQQSAGPQITGQNADYTGRFTDMSGERFTFVVNANGTAYYTKSLDGTGTQYESPVSTPNLIIGNSIVIRATSVGYYLYNLTDNTLTMTTASLHVYGTTVTYNGSTGAWTLESGEITASGTADFALVATTDGPIGSYSGPVKTTLGQKIWAGAYDQTQLGPIRMAEFTDGQQTGEAFPAFRWTSYDSTAGTATLVAATDIVYNVTYSVDGETQQIGDYEGITATGNSATRTNILYAPITYYSTASEDGVEGTNAVLLSIIPVMLFIVTVMMAVRVLQQAR